LRSCPNRNCRLVHEDEVQQCPECGANMSRKPDEPIDPNMELFRARDRAMRERSLESRLNSRRSSLRGEEIDTGASPEVLETASEAAEFILGAS